MILSRRFVSVFQSRRRRGGIDQTVSSTKPNQTYNEQPTIMGNVDLCQ